MLKTGGDRFSSHLQLLKIQTGRRCEKEEKMSNDKKIREQQHGGEGKRKKRKRKGRRM